VPRAKRQERNQELFRQANENIAETSTRLEVETQAFFCECSQTGCTEMLEVPVAVYDRVRSDESRYLIRRGHQDRAKEVIIECPGDYLIVTTKLMQVMSGLSAAH
jgi:hypothetical protein